jgi:hypothetical protein
MFRASPEVPSGGYLRSDAIWLGMTCKRLPAPPPPVLYLFICCILNLINNCNNSIIVLNS